MILVWLVGILMIGGLSAWFANRWGAVVSRGISVAALGIDLVIAIGIWISKAGQLSLTRDFDGLLSVNWAWIPQFGVNFHLAIDGLSLLLILLSLFLGLLSVLVSWTEIDYRVGFYHFNLLWILAGIVGVFMAMDLFLFYFFWEVMLIPMYLLIGIWGHENRIYAAYKFFIFTQASGLLMLLSILGLYFIHFDNTGELTFNYLKLLGTSIPIGISFWLMLGFLIAFVVKLPIVPVHNWLPDAHTEAPTAGSVILAGLLLKTGAYGIMRFVIPLFPEASALFAPTAMLLGVIGILYGAKLAFAQTDLKRLVAYTSVSHMGFVMLGVFAFNQLAFQGVVMQMITHGFSTGALFILVGAIQERIHTRDINDMGGFFSVAPRMGGIGLLFAMASLGLPGLGNFIAEMLVLFGSFQSVVANSQLMTILASVGLVAATVYSLRIVQQVFYGEYKREKPILDFSLREMGVMGAMTVVIIWLGLYPQPVLDTAESSLKNILKEAPTEKSEKKKTIGQKVEETPSVERLTEVYSEKIDKKTGSERTSQWNK